MSCKKKRHTDSRCYEDDFIGDGFEVRCLFIFSFLELNDNHINYYFTFSRQIVSDAINGLVSAIQAIVLQQQEERNMHKRSEKLERKLFRELSVLSELEMKSAESLSSEGADSVSTTKHPLVLRRAKVEVLKKLVEDEKAKCASAVKVTRIMILNNLQINLPSVFQALMVYSDAYVQSFEVLLGNESVSDPEETTTGAT